MTSMPETNSGVLQGIRIVVITFKLYVPTGRSFPVQVKFIDVVRRTSTTLDVLLESRIDDYWHVDGGRRIHNIERKSSKTVTCGLESVSQKFKQYQKEKQEKKEKQSKGEKGKGEKERKGERRKKGKKRRKRRNRKKLETKKTYRKH